MKIFLNYIGQLRIYSLLDLILLLVAVRAIKFEILGAILLHIAFLAYLEYSHCHSYRKNISKIVWIIFGLVGAILFSHIIAILGYIILSFFYCLKNNRKWGISSPVMRGLQNYFIVGSIIGYLNNFTLVVFFAFFLRNLLGDFRDITKDRKEEIKTIPILLNFKRDYKYLHLFSLFITSTLWWMYSTLPFEILIIILVIQVLTYNLTPRK